MRISQISLVPNIDAYNQSLFYELQGNFRFEGPTFPSIQELITHQLKSSLPVTSRSGAILKTPIMRERWELSNDDVVLIEKIGRVSGKKCFLLEKESSIG